MDSFQPFGGPLGPVVPASTFTALRLVAAERERQRARWGDDGHPDAQPWHDLGALLVSTQLLRDVVARSERGHGVSWLEILLEEVGEVRDAAVALEPRELLAANRAARREALRCELVQVAAVAVAWLEDLQRREPEEG